jgi:hypothetical protein
MRRRAISVAWSSSTSVWTISGPAGVATTALKSPIAPWATRKAGSSCSIALPLSTSTTVVWSVFCQDAPPSPGTAY